MEGDTQQIVHDMALFDYYCYAAVTCYVYKLKYNKET